MDNLFWIGFVGAALALIFAYLQKCKVMKCSEGDEKMVKIASSIRAGANAYLKQQYSTVAKVFAVVFVILLIIAFASKGQMLSRVTPFAFLTGGIWSMLAGLIGMKIATAANARTANAAHESLNHGLNVAFSSGTVMGFTVVGLGILDITLWFIGLRYIGKITDPTVLANIMVMNGMGASFMALFARVGGGIYTKAADVGADLVGKVEAGIPEDDPRNPATIADNVGDNVGDVAGMGADLYESYVGSILATFALSAAAGYGWNGMLLPVALAVCALALYSGGSLPLTRCLLMLIASFMLYAELESAGNMADNLQMLGASMDKANSIDDTPVMDIDGAELRPEDASVQFEDVSFSYGERTILDHVSLTVPTGSTTAVVGPSGGGKTTLCNLIARFWDVQGGRITVGGHDVREYKLDSLMKNISMVFQSVYLFNDTVENNIKFSRPTATHEQVVAAAKAACCHDFITALPDGYDTVLGEGGGSLSGGEKQRISIARAMLKDAPIVILDEATASVDPENEAELQAAISSLTKGKTLLVIAHRLSTIKNADQIIVLKEGEVQASGTHQELLAENSLYRDMWNAHIGAKNWSAGSKEGR